MAGKITIVNVSVTLKIFILFVSIGSCVSCTINSLRLQSNGTLQICTDKQWKAVCAQDWGGLDTAVACRQLGYDGGYMYRRESYPSSIAATTVDRREYHCNGTEKTLSNCVSQNITSCTQGVNVTCVYRNSSDLCNSGDIRLWGGNTTYEGNIEMCTDHKVWSAISSNGGWNNPGAVVACRQLGYPNAIAIPFHGSVFGRRYQPIEFGYLQCSGRENYLKNCSSYTNTHFVNVLSGYSWSNIGHYAGVRCLPKNNVSCSNGAVKLTGGYLASNGIAEICLDGSWIGMCQSSQPLIESRICAALNYSRYARIDPNFFQLYKGKSMAYVYLAAYRCQSESAGLLDCVQNETSYGVVYRSPTSCSPYGIICCSNDMCNIKLKPTIDQKEFSLHFDTMAAHLVYSDSVDLRGLENDIQNKAVKCISDNYQQFTSSALEDGVFYFDDEMLYKGKISGLGGISADELIMQLMQCITKEPWIEYYNTDLRLHVTFGY